MPTTAISYDWFDGEEAHKSVVAYYDSADVATVADAQAVVDDFIPLLNAVSGCAVINASVSFDLTAVGAATPDSGYRVDAGAILSFRDSDGVGQSIYIPGMLASRMSNGVVNDADTDVAALIAAIRVGTGVHDTVPLSSRGSASIWSTFRGGKQTTRKTTR